jgi:UDP-N-acetylglucosamine--N-acetylmuramyl-(pentapeptide) pyrophosphoryl-undecaprenol N-acetylglucosamine transferase
MGLKVLIASGGTGGHLFPAQQLAELLKGCHVVFAGHKLASNPFFHKKVPFHEVASASKKRKWFSLLKGVWQSFSLIRRLQPQVVVGFGSFHSFPVLMAAVLLRKKIVLFEANCSLGKVNRFFTPFAKKVAFQFPIAQKKAVYVPLLPWVGKQMNQVVCAEARKFYNLQPDVFTILVFGGSQGAAFINQIFCAAAAQLHAQADVFQVIHLTGKEGGGVNYDFPSVVKPFETDMAMAYAAADLVVCRCGAGTTAELIRFQKPAILIPYPYAHDHQRKNGEFLQKNGARMVLQKEASVERLAAEIRAIRQELPLRIETLQQIALPQTIDFGELVHSVGANR